MMASEVEKPMIDALRRDLGTFSDPGTSIDVEVEGMWCRATWSQNGKRKGAKFSFSGQGIYPELVEVKEGVVSYRAFLAGPNMADLRGLARNMVNVIKPVSDYVPPFAMPLNSGREVGESLDAGDLISELASQAHEETRVVFIAAEAGVGKTTLLRQLVRDKADSYRTGEEEALWLYVSAQGRRLAQLDEAIAAELDDLRSRVPYHVIAPLVRCGAMVLVVDGFDELIGSVGSYDEAFSSLASFISDLNGSGCILAAARSTYYEQEFLSRASSSASIGFDTGEWSLQGVELLEWDDVQRREHIESAARSSGIRDEDLAGFVETVLSVLGEQEVRAVGHKPLFVTRTVEILKSGSLPAGSSLLDRLVSAYVRREVTEKLRSSTGTPILEDGQYRSLLTELAEEMWRQEARELSRTSVRELVGIFADLMGVAGEQLAEVVERLPYAALLAKGSLPGSVTFEHDIFYSYFLAEPTANAWSSLDPKMLGRLLRKGRLPEEAAYMAGRRMHPHQVQSLLAVLTDAVASVKDSLDVEQVRRNAGSLVGSFLQGRSFDRIRIRNLVIGDVSLGGTVISQSELSELRFIGTALENVVFAECVGNNVAFDRVIVDRSSTRIDISGLGVDRFYGVGVRDTDRYEMYYSPVSVASILRDCGLPDAQEEVLLRPVPQEIVSLVERLCHLYLQANALTENDDVMVSVVNHPSWRKVRGAALESGLLYYVKGREASGRKRFLKRNARPEEIMLALDPRAEVSAVVAEFWDLLTPNSLM